jgi:hypothetical protein
MKELLNLSQIQNVFNYSPLHIQIVFVFWLICVVMFYSMVGYVLVMTAKNLILNTFKSFVK